MITRTLWPIIGSYLRRRIFWLFALLYALFSWAGTLVPPREESLLVRQTEIQWLPRKEFDGMTAFLNWQATEDELRNLRGLQIRGSFPVESAERGPDGKPLLTLKDDSIVTSEHLDKLARCSLLTDLRWFTVDLTPELGETLARLPNLQRLQLSLIGRPIPSLQHLPALPNLRYFHVPLVPPSELGLLRRHPLLNVIELPDSEAQQPADIPGSPVPQAIWTEPSTLQEATQIEFVVVNPVNEFTKAMMNHTPMDRIPPEAHSRAVPISEGLRTAIASLPNLKAVEVRDPLGGWPKRMSDDPGLRAALASRPEVAVNPRVLDPRSAINPFIVFCAIIAIGVIATQLFSQFASSGSQVTPHFAASHLTVAAGFLSVHLLIAAWILQSQLHVSWISILAIVSATPAIGAFLLALICHYPQTAPFALPFAFAGSMGVGMAGSVLAGDGFANDFLNGEHLPFALLALAIELSMIFLAGRSLASLSPRLNESGVASVTGLYQVIQQLQIRKMFRTERRGSAPRPAWKRLDQKLERFLAKASSADPWKQWSAAEVMGIKNITWISLASPFFLLAIFTLVVSILSREPFSWRMYLFSSIYLGTFVFPICTLIRAGSMLSRRPTIGQELLRPMSRNDLHRFLKWSPWRDLWPAALGTLGYLFLLTYVLPWGPQAWQENMTNLTLLGHALLCLTLPLPIWSGLLFMMTIQKESRRNLALILGYFAIMASVQFFVLSKFLPNATLKSNASHINFISAGVCLIVGALFFLWAQRRLRRVEWGA